MGLDELWFQQDGATAHTSEGLFEETINVLRTKFEDRIISIRGEVDWPPRSCDLTPLDFFLWGYLKSKVYANNPTTTQDLKHNIRNEIEAIDPLILQKVIDNFDIRMLACNRSRGGHMNDVVFHT